MLDIRRRVPLAPLTTLNIGGSAEFFVSVKSVEELRAAYEYARNNDLPVLVLGGGSNVLMTDSGWKGLVVQVSIEGIEFKVLEREEGDGEDATHGTGGIVEVKVGAGCKWDDFVSCVVDKKLWGVENLSGIPGTVGGAVVQNINAYGVTIEDVVKEVTTFNLKTGKLHTFAKEECSFSYRDSLFKAVDAQGEYCITSVVLQLALSGSAAFSYRSSRASMQEYFEKEGIVKPNSHDVRNAVLAIRERIGMLQGQSKSAGSFFKNIVASKEEFASIREVVEREYGTKSRQFEPWHWELSTGKEKVSSAFLMECTEYNKTDFLGKSFCGVVGISPVHTLSIVNKAGASASDVKDFVKVIQRAVQDKFNVMLEPEVTLVNEK